jgi:hypothetical protein
MISFKQFLSEKRSPTRPALWGVEAETALKAIKTNCSKAIKEAQEGRLLYRGVKGLDESYRAGDSALVMRKTGSQQFPHFHWLTNVLPSWKDYPSRNHAYICSTSYSEAKRYADGGHVFVVFPYDNARIAICPTHDMKNSFPELKSMKFNQKNQTEDFNHAIGPVINAIVGKGNVGKSAEAIADQLKQIDFVALEKVILDATVEKNYALKSAALKFHRMIKGYSNLFDALNDFMDPEMNGFETHLMGDLPSDNREVWVVGKLVAKEIGVDDQQLKMLSDRLKIDHTLFHV